MQTESKLNIKVIVPIMLSFFVMGMVDLVGVSSNYVRVDFSLDDFTASVLPMMVFLWFAIFSIPTGIIMSRIGRKKTVLISIAIHLVALLLAFGSSNFYAIVLSFALLGIGNTMLQVSLNPLVADIVSGRKLTSTLTFGQFVKAIASFLAPIVATRAAIHLQNWKLIFVIYAAIALVSLLWLAFVSVEENKNKEDSTPTTFGKTLATLKDTFVLQMFLGILLVVGIDVCMNTNTPQLFMQRLSMSTETAGLSSSLYFGARTVGAFIGAMILARTNASNFMKANMVGALVAFVLIMFAENEWMLYIAVFLVGFTCANVFSIIFSVALQYKPRETNEISSLMIMGVAGGAIITPFVGLVAKGVGIALSFGILLLCAAYLFYLSFKFSSHDQSRK